MKRWNIAMNEKFDTLREPKRLLVFLAGVIAILVLGLFLQIFWDRYWGLIVELSIIILVSGFRLWYRRSLS